MKQMVALMLGILGLGAIFIQVNEIKDNGNSLKMV